MTGPELSVHAAVYCHMGGRRSNNQDNFYLDGTWKPLERQNCNCLLDHRSAQPALFAVCDGMGGQQHGEVASLLAVSWLHRYRADFLDGPSPDTRGARALVQMSRDLWKGSQARGLHMGSTVAAAAVCGQVLYAFGLGDSRIYLLEQGQLQQLTQDHTLAAQAEYYGLTGGQALSAEDPRSHQLTQYFGMDCSEYDPTPCCRGVPLRAGQRFLLCSDGLSDCLGPGELAQVLGYGGPRACARALVATALAHGGSDNITAMVLEPAEISHGGQPAPCPNQS